MCERTIAKHNRNVRYLVKKNKYMATQTKIHRMPLGRLISRKPLVYGLAFLVAGSLGAYSLLMANAATGQLYIEPSSVNVQKDNNLTISVKLNTPSPADSIEARLTFDPTKLQLVSTDTATSAFPSQVQSTSGTDYIQFVRGILAPDVVTGDVTVIKVSFRALSDTGSTNLSLTGNTAFAGNSLDPLVSGGVVTFEGLPPPPPPPSSDTTPPIVNITAPVNNATLKGKGKVAISASATDNVSVTSVELYIDGTLKSKYTTGSFTYSWDLKTVAKGSHSILVKAYDSSGNIGQTGVTVNRR